MAHITFIHGISNKPPEKRLLDNWLKSLARGTGLDVPALGITHSMVYWADVLYDKPLPDVEEVLEAMGGAAEIPEARGAGPPPTMTTLSEADFVAGLALNFGMVAGAAEVTAPPTLAPGTEDLHLERFPVPGFIKKRVMEAYLRDVHHYLFNIKHSPRSGETFAVQEEIRNRMVKALKAGAAHPGPHVIVSHSMGTVIAYDCLKRVADCPEVDALLTIGSPLGLDEIQDRLVPEWTRLDGFPRERLRGAWVNVFDRLDPVAGLDPFLANDYRNQGNPGVQDINEQNFGRWRHDIAKYLAGPKLRAALKQLLNLP